MLVPVATRLATLRSCYADRDLFTADSFDYILVRCPYKTVPVRKERKRGWRTNTKDIEYLIQLIDCQRRNIFNMILPPKGELTNHS
jgi:hypothetical protein